MQCRKYKMIAAAIGAVIVSSPITHCVAIDLYPFGYFLWIHIQKVLKMTSI